MLPYNTFHINVTARYFASFATVGELAELLTYAKNKSLPLLVLGGGSNILLTHDFEGLVLKNSMEGVGLVKEDNLHYYVKAGGGENWHRFVQYCVEQGYAGLENLSLIPGCVGTSPMQNIGAFGVEIKDVFDSLEAWDIEEGKVVTFTLNDCGFGYRESAFKHQYKGRFVILTVTFRLNKQPLFHTSYGALEQELQRMQVKEPGIKAIAQAVINIRVSKLPDPAVIGNAGSFFKNPQIANAQFTALKQEYPGIQGYPAGDGYTKIFAGWLIEQCGWKGYRRGDCGVHAKHALVLVNYGNAEGNDIFNLSCEILDSVQNKFGITLEREVNIV